VVIKTRVQPEENLLAVTSTERRAVSASD